MDDPRPMPPISYNRNSFYTDNLCLLNQCTDLCLVIRKKEEKKGLKKATVSHSYRLNKQMVT
jgi:hypothetical protein